MEHQTMNQQKVSAMVVDIAWEYIQQGESLAERKRRLTLACTAWNYACVPDNVSLDLLDSYIDSYRNWNPDATEEECRVTKRDIKNLMKVKRRKYPDIAVQIISNDLVPGDDEERVVVAFASQEV